mgnify:CR=1 FL=1
MKLIELMRLLSLGTTRAIGLSREKRSKMLIKLGTR